MLIDLANLTVGEDARIQDVVRLTSRSLRIAFVVGADMQFKGLMTDGDVKDAMLSGASPDDSISGRYNTSPVVSDPAGNISPKGADLRKVFIVPVVDDGRLISYRHASSFDRVAIVTGVTGQDGAYLAHLLLKKNYRVAGAYRRSSTPSFERLDRLGITDQVDLVSFDLTDLSSAISLMQRYEPHEVYNLAAQSFVGSSFADPLATSLYTGIGALNILEAVRLVNPAIRLYQASSSEMYGNANNLVQSEATPFNPRSPYATSKVFAHHMALNYRDAYGLRIWCGILFNHESPLRGLEFVTRKITHTGARIKLGVDKELVLGNINSARDWGYAPDYVEAMWQMLQLDSPDDFVIATGTSHTVRDFAERAFDRLGLDLDKYLRVHRKFLRPIDVEYLRGDPGKAADVFGFEPQRTPFHDIVNTMVDADLELVKGNPKVAHEWPPTHTLAAPREM